MNLNSKLNLDFCKIRNVKTPAKAFDAAGIDFFVPENLHYSDFSKNFSIYANEWLIPNTTSNDGYDELPIEFKMKNENKNVSFVLKVKYNKNNNQTLCMGVKEDGSSFNPLEYISLDDTVISEILVKPNAKVLIPSGIKVKLPAGVALDATNKSGIASKRGLIVGAELIDPDYMGEIHINLINTNNDNSVVISAGDKIVQFLPLFIPNFSNVNEFATAEELFADKQSERGEGGFGSTGTK